MMVPVDTAAAARSELAPRESWWGEERRVSAWHPAALAGLRWVGGMWGTATSSSKALAAPNPRLVAKGSPQR